MNHEASSIDAIRDGMRACELPPHVLLAEDDEPMREMLAGLLRDEGYDVTEVDNGAQLIRVLELAGASKLQVELVITDVRMPGFSGLEVLEYMRFTGWSVPVIVMTSAGDERTHAEARDLDASEVLDMPFEIATFKAAITPILPPPSSRPKMVTA
jgi:DNA-binding response OmpR family regulator